MYGLKASSEIAMNKISGQTGYQPKAWPDVISSTVKFWNPGWKQSSNPVWLSCLQLCKHVCSLVSSVNRNCTSLLIYSIINKASTYHFSAESALATWVVILYIRSYLWAFCLLLRCSIVGKTWDCSHFQEYLDMKIFCFRIVEISIVPWNDTCSLTFQWKKIFNLKRFLIKLNSLVCKEANKCEKSGRISKQNRLFMSFF